MNGLVQSHSQVTVMQSALMKPLAFRYLSTAGVPPTLCTSSITYLQ